MYQLTRRRLLQTGMTAIAGAAVAGTPALAARRRPRAAPPGDGRYVGELRLFAGTYVPESWLGCDGQEYNDLQYSQLAALIGTTYGSVQRDRAFQPLLPDLRGRTAIGAGEGPGHPAWQRGDKERTLAAKGEAPAGLGLRYMISPTGGEEDQLLGEIRAFAFHFAPRYWLPCIGERVEISQHVDVFSLVGDTYGGDAKTYFQTPDLSGRSPLGVGDVLELPRVGLGERFNDLAPSAEPHPRRLHLNYCLAMAGVWPSRPNRRASEQQGGTNGADDRRGARVQLGGDPRGVAAVSRSATADSRSPGTVQSGRRCLRRRRN